jgi:tRNA threonylcarbamoyladenosine modification (KEOPS) complex Cgi121 subunit
VPKGTRFHTACWEVRIKSEEVEGLLASTREQNPRAVIQIFGADGPPNPTAVEMVAAQTLAAAKSGSTLAERPELDLLLRLAGTRQIGEAFKRVGYRSGGRRLFMVAAYEGDGAALERLARELARDKRFTQLAKRRLAKGDLDQVEGAALLAARL